MLSDMAETSSEPPPPRAPRGARDIRSISARSGRDPRAVVAAYAGLSSRETAADVARAAADLGFAPPPPKGR